MEILKLACEEQLSKLDTFNLGTLQLPANARSIPLWKTDYTYCDLPWRGELKQWVTVTVREIPTQYNELVLCTK